MAKFNIEVELDWPDEEISIDEEIKEQVVKGIRDRMLEKVSNEATKALDNEIGERTTEAAKKIQERVDAFLENICEDKIANMMIPIKKGSSWSTEYDFIPMSEFVGKRYEEFLNRKIFDREGNRPRYDSEKNTSLNEFFINRYLEQELAGKVSSMIQKSRAEAEDSIIKTLEQTLKDQLSVDIIKRLNIPKMLENLQQKALGFEEKED